MSITKLIKPTESLTYDSLWLRTIRDHRKLLLSRSDTESVTVPPNLQVATSGDPRGFLLSIGTRRDLIPVVIILNKLEDITSFVNVRSVFIPSVEAITELKKKISSKYAT